MMYCPACGKKYETGKFCLDDGTKLVEEAKPSAPAKKTKCVCPKCGAVLPVGSKFCDKCGAPITQAEEKAVENKPSDNKNTESDSDYKKGKVAYDNVDYETAVKYYKKALEKNEYNVAALVGLGICYEYGEGVDEDNDRAKEYLKKAAILGDSNAQNQLGDIAAGKEDSKTAVKWYKKAIETDGKNTDALNSLGDCYRLGKGVEQDTDKAKEYYTRSAKLENSMAQNMLGLIASDKKDYKTAFGWYTKAVETNKKNIAALYKLGDCYQRGEGVIRDIGKAKEYYTKAAELGDSDSQNKLGDMAYSKKNYREAERLYKKAIETNEKNADALFKLGRCYYISYDEKTAKKYLLKAIELGKTDAAPFLGWIYFNEGNYVESLGYFRDGARNNDPGSVFMLGYCYRYGKGVSSNEEKAVNYFQQAKDLGYKDENNELNKLKIFGHYI